MKIKLSTINENDLEHVTNWVGNKNEQLLWSGKKVFLPLCHSERLEDDREQFGLYLDNECIGYGELQYTDSELKTANINRIIISPGQRKKGFGTEMMSLMFDYAFNTKKLHRIESMVFTHNVAASKLCKKSGFRTEGLLRDIFKVGNDYWSGYTMSILEEEYQFYYGQSFNR